MRSILARLGRLPRGFVAAGIFLSLTLAVAGMAAPASVVRVRATPRPVEVTVPIPATTIEGLSDSEERVIEPTGRVKPARARGTVRFSCCSEVFLCFCSYDWPKRLTIPAGTRLSVCASGLDAAGHCARRGAGFVTLAPVVLREKDTFSDFFASYRRSAEVPVRAIEPGPTGNVSAGASWVVEQPSIAGVKIQVVVGETSGGLSGDERVMTQRDVDRTVHEIVETLLADDRDHLRRSAEGQGLTLGAVDPRPAIERNPFISDFRDTFSATNPETVEVRLWPLAYAYDDEGLADRVEALASRSLPEGWRLREGTVSFDLEQMRVEEGKLLVDVRAESVPDPRSLARIIERLGPARAAESIDSMAGMDAVVERRFAFPLQDRARLEVVIG